MGWTTVAGFRLFPAPAGSSTSGSTAPKDPPSAKTGSFPTFRSPARPAAASARSAAGRAGRVLCEVERIEVEGSDGEQAVLGNAEVADCRLFGERGRPPQMGRF